MWITNIHFPATCKKLGITLHPGGGWMSSLAMELIRMDGVTLAVGTVYEGNEFQEYSEGGINYYLLPKSKANTQYDKTLEVQWARIVDEFHPNIVHIHGTEFAHGLAFINSCPKQRVVVSIQGLVSVYSEYYYAGIKTLDIVRHITYNDIRRLDTIFRGKRKFRKRGELEHDYIRKSNHIIGRTTWDYAHTTKVNPNVEYHFCNEVLRKSFYDSPKWSINHKVDHTIFLSQAGYPIKGFHQVLKAIAIVQDHFPNTKIRVAGVDITKNTTWREKMRISGYGAYLGTLINKLKIKDVVTFTGTLSEEQMVEEYKNAHVFICPSSIENSPNSLGEAQIIGTPCIASFVGGIPDMVKDGESGLLYRFDDYTILAFQILRIFNDENLALTLSINGQVVATKRHNRDIIKSRMLEIYSKIIQ
ncbi:MAG: glycosyltransferase family 4 protein [Nostocales cyanobacterium W4_Combined_metabat2_030]|nr:glycosyltransferase family 4 protein [Nostocales cyanobacterium W4_Combined_metabat2_030]